MPIYENRDRRVIYKYEIEITDFYKVKMPEDAFILKFGKQRGKYFIWVMVDPDKKLVERRFRIVGTGNPVEGNFLYANTHIGTWIETDGPYVWHLFENTRSC